MDGQEQTTISPEFLENIQSAVNSQGVLGQVQVIETENGPVTVLFMEEGADGSNIDGDNITLTVSDADLTNTSGAVAQNATQDVQLQYHVQSDQDYTQFLQGGTTEEVITSEVVKEDTVASVEPVIGVSEQTTVPAETVEQKAGESTDTYFITDTGEILKIDSSLLGDFSDATLQLQTQDGSYQILNQLGSTQPTAPVETSQTYVQPASQNMNITYSDNIPLEFTATKVGNPTVVDTSRVEEPKVLSYKTTNRQRTNIMRQPVPKSSPATIMPKTSLVNQTVKTNATSLLTQPAYKTMKQVNASSNTSEILYPKSYQKQTIVFPKVNKSHVTGSTQTPIQQNYQRKVGIGSQQMITTVVKPQSLLKSSVDQSSLSNKHPSTQIISGQTPPGNVPKTILYSDPKKIAAPSITRQIPAVTKQQADLLSVAMKHAEVPEQILASSLAVQKSTGVPTIVKESGAAPLPAQTIKPVIAGVKESILDSAVVKSVVEDPLPSTSLLISSAASTLVSTTGTSGTQVVEKQLVVPELPIVSQQTAVESTPTLTAVATDMLTQDIPLSADVTDIPTEQSSKEMEGELKQRLEGQTQVVQGITEVNGEKKEEKPEEETSVKQSEDESGVKSKLDLPEAEKDKEHVDKVGTNAGKSKESGQLKSIDVPNSDVTIQLFADGTLVTRDKAGLNYSQVKLEDLGLDLSMLDGNTDIELLIVQGDGKEVRATINTSTDINPSPGPVQKAGKSDITSNTPNANKASEEISAEGNGDAQTQVNVARPYKCSMCPRTFKYFRTFKCHEIVHTKAVTFTCHLCQRLFAREVNLQSHLELHKKKGAIRPSQESADMQSRQCPYCKKFFPDKDKLQTHVKAQHGQNVKVPCQLCGKLFANETSMQRHIYKYHPWPTSCPHCHKMFEDEVDYQDHLQTEHADLMYCCRACDAILPSKKAFVNHTVTQHSNAEELLKCLKEIECPICDKKFMKQSMLESHMEIHNKEKMHQCPGCLKSFKSISRLEQHIQDVHDNDVVFTCPECEEKFTYKGKLDLHMTLYHNGSYHCLTCYEEFPDRMQLEEHQFNNHDISFECSKCNTKFPTSTQLRHHLKTHTSKKILCDICGAGFEFKPQLKTHLFEMHFERDLGGLLKKYPSLTKVNAETLCDLCGEFFGTKPLYKQHLRDIHFGGDTVELLKYFPFFEKVPDPPEPVTCDHCGKVCPSITHLNVHLKTHIKVKEKSKPKEEFNSTDDEQEDEVDLSNIEPREIDKNYKCSQCGANFTRKAALLKHKSSHQKDEFKEALKQIEMEETARAELEEMGVLPKPRKSQSPVKKPASTGKKQASTGKKQTSTGKKPKLVKAANKTPVSTKVKLKFKEKKQSTENQEHVCEVCDDKFTTDDEFVAHMQDEHGATDFKLESKTNATPSKSNVRFDLETFTCLTCDKLFNARKYLRRHLNRMHNFKEEKFYSPIKSSSAKAKSPASGKKSGKKVKKGNDTSEDMEVDTEEKEEDSTTDITTFLGKNFNLGKAHKCNIESVKTKQHRCSICGEGFSREATLRKHYILHETGLDLEIKPEEDYADLQTAIYTCTSCGNKYSTALGLIHHNRSKHSDVDEESVLEHIAEVDEQLKQESPIKKAKGVTKGTKRKAETDGDETDETAQKKIKLGKDGKERFVCGKCGAVYITTKGLKRHEEELHGGSKSESVASPVKYSHSGRAITKSKKLSEQVQCDICNKIFMEEKNLKLHIKNKHKVEFIKPKVEKTEDVSTDSFYCDHCPREFDKRINLRRHTKMKHNIDLPAETPEKPMEVEKVFYHCDVCDKMFSALSSLQHHLISIHDENFTDIQKEAVYCQICEQPFVTEKALRVHMRKHTGEKPYKCCLCNKQFMSRYHLETHMKCLHTTLFNKKVKCKICLMLFETDKAMLKHKVIHRNPSADDDDIKPESKNMQKCKQCDKAFRWKKSLDSHVEAFHKNADPQTCGVCNKVFPDMASVKAHMSEHQKTDAAFSCSLCDKTFSKESSLKIHESHIHKAKSSPSASGFSCDICKESFQTKMKLMEHMLTHTSVMPYKCDICSASFKQEFKLKAHKLTHKLKKKTENLDSGKSDAGNEKSSGQQKYKCTKCSKQFDKPWHLKTHITKTHKGKMPMKVALTKNRVTRARSSSMESSSSASKSDKPAKNTAIKEKKIKTKILKKEKLTYFCQKCKLNFIKVRSYNTHLLTIHGEKGDTKNEAKEGNVKPVKKLALKPKTKPVQSKNNEKLASDKKTKPKTNPESGKDKVNTVGYDCPICRKMFSKQFRLKNHIKEAHNVQMEDSPQIEAKRKKCLYCAECARVFWSQAQYDTHNKRLHPDRNALDMDKQVATAMSGEVKTEPAEAFSPLKETDFETVQHKCEFCLKIHWTKKLFDEHMLKEHPEHAAEYGISATDNPSIEVINDNVDMMGNCLSVELYDESTCDKLSSLPVVSIQRMNDQLNKKGTDQQADMEVEENDSSIESENKDSEVGEVNSEQGSKERSPDDTVETCESSNGDGDFEFVISGVESLEEKDTAMANEQKGSKSKNQEVTDDKIETVQEASSISDKEEDGNNLEGIVEKKEDTTSTDKMAETERLDNTEDVEEDENYSIIENVEEDGSDDEVTAAEGPLELETSEDNTKSNKDQEKHSNILDDSTEASFEEPVLEREAGLSGENEMENNEESENEKEQENIDWEAIDDEIKAAVEGENGNLEDDNDAPEIVQTEENQETTENDVNVVEDSGKVPEEFDSVVNEKGIAEDEPGKLPGEFDAEVKEKVFEEESSVDTAKVTDSIDTDEVEGDLSENQSDLEEMDLS